ncbi:Na+/H+ antiporter NhaA [Sphingobacterium sp. IITKGP-BTPF85]|uniref:Na+/H+ antiporter NhaA n=1 Tax=Sphingobacterium sp. IITKGP-BTPF85 TaxID=1338009 RepID=UPI000389FF35|nr:Na+/H+ antiporter NhaA [Sphingobacterium sp. IITKGP-BTPF85]KKX49787.1 hypothetical protein L950_0213890 [Sphingobacterium sp. IITKGP-BTPF85]
MKKIFKKFFESASSGGIILFVCVIISLGIANSPLGTAFENLLSFPLGFENPSIHLKYSLALWINDGLMAIFFLLVGLEIKRELINGGLSTPRQAALPIISAIGGALIPAGIYVFLNGGTETASGWGIPMATDIAFALAILAMLGNKVPSSLKIFLAALAIVDDLIAILVIAIFYSAELHVAYLGYAAGIMLLLIIFNKMGIRSLAFYIIPGLFIWYFIHHSGIHATIAGVLTALAIPMTTKGEKQSPLLKLEHALVNPVNFLIVPIFALANTNIRFESAMLDGLVSPLGLGIIIGLCIGKPVGVLLMSKLAVKLNIAQLPAGATWRHIIGLGSLAGVGFTMAIFISLLSFTDGLLIAEAKFSILIASLLSGIIGYTLLNSSNKLKKQINMLYKTEEEIELIKASAMLVSKTLASIAGIIKPGITTLELDTHVNTFIRDNGAIPSFHNYGGFPFNVCASVNDAVVHGFPNKTPLKEGDIVSIDVGAYKDGFHGDQAYTFIIGEVDKNILNLVKVTKDSLVKGIEKAIHGNRVGDIGYAIQSHVEPHGYGIVKEFAGHGLGRSLHEAPDVPNYGRKGQGKMLKENLVIAIEPMINFGMANIYTADDEWTVLTKDGNVSVHFEQDVCVKKGKALILTDFGIIEQEEKANSNLNSSYY